MRARISALFIGYTQCLELCLTHKMLSINICLMNEGRRERTGMDGEMNGWWVDGQKRENESSWALQGEYF